MTAVQLSAAEFYVDASAAAGGDGSATRPFSTLDAAREAVAGVRNKPVTVKIRPGHYVERNGWKLGPIDSREPGAAVSYEAYGGTPRISTGVIVPPAAMKSVTDPAIRARLPEEVRDKVMEVSLDGLDIDVMRLPEKFRGLELVEAFWDGKRLPISRWPNDGVFAKIEVVTDNGLKGKGGTFVYRGDEPAKWVGALEDGVWLRGFWRVPWVIEGVRVSGIDQGNRTITLASPIAGGIGSKYHRAANNGPGPGSGDEPWEAINLVEEIDQPGEWAVRFSTKTFYILPPADSGELLITDSREPAVALNQVSNTSLVGLAVDSALGDGIRVEGGENVLIAGCKVKNVAHDGIVLVGGKKHTILSCDTSDTGYSGINFLGGERRTLTPGGHRILNNLVTRAGVYYPAAGILGGIGPQSESVGNLVAYNRIHDCANSGVVYAGNDNTFEYNEIYRIGLGSSDLGCFYTTGAWTSRGNIVRYNFVHHAMNANAFYVDDGDSGDTFFGNIAYKTQSGGFVGGGHDQVFRNNIIVSSPRAMHVDARGVARGYTVNDKRLRGDLESVPYKESPWKDRYPELVNILETKPEYPSGIVIEDNLFVSCETDLRRANSDQELQGVVFQNNYSSDDLSMFVDVAALDFTLKPDAPVFASIPSFEQVPVAKIGLYPDQYRPEVPPRDIELLQTGETKAHFDSQTDIDASNRQQ